MRTEYYDGNLFLLPRSASEAAVVTTNGIVTSRGLLVMGAGIAKYCRDEYPGIDSFLARHVKANGNVPAWCGPMRDRHREAVGLDPMVNVMSCPTKVHWQDPSDLRLIACSCRLMAKLADEHGLTRVYIPALGCNNGRLDWRTQVEPVCRSFLDDRFVAAVRL